jgi:predicted DNA-binding WGR domain protein
MLVLTKIDPEQNMARFYVLHVQPTLFGEFALVREWGRIGGGSRRRSVFYSSETEAKAAFDREFKRRQRRNYVMASGRDR